MRGWDVKPGSRDRASLLGEHRDIHAMVSTPTHAKRRYTWRPEARRGALTIGHDLVVYAMELRGNHAQS